MASPNPPEFCLALRKPIGKGSRFYFEEEIKGHKHKMLMEITEYIENAKLSFSSKLILKRSEYFLHQDRTVLSENEPHRSEILKRFPGNIFSGG